MKKKKEKITTDLRLLLIAGAMAFLAFWVTVGLIVLVGTWLFGLLFPDFSEFHNTVSFFSEFHNTVSFFSEFHNTVPFVGSRFLYMLLFVFIIPAVIGTIVWKVFSFPIKYIVYESEHENE